MSESPKEEIEGLNKIIDEKIESIGDLVIEQEKLVAALRPFAEIADAYDPDTWRAGPSPYYAVLDECREARRVLIEGGHYGQGSTEQEAPVREEGSRPSAP